MFFHTHTHTHHLGRKIDGQSNFVEYQLSWIISGEKSDKGKEQENPENIKPFTSWRWRKTSERRVEEKWIT